MLQDDNFIELTYKTSANPWYQTVVEKLKKGSENKIIAGSGPTHLARELNMVLKQQRYLQSQTGTLITYENT